MSLQGYGVLKGRPIERKTGTGRSPHYQIRVVDSTTEYRIALNTKSQESPSELQYVVIDDFNHPIIEKLKTLQLGFTAAPSRPNDIALDFIRGNLFPREAMRILPTDLAGPDNDLNDELDKYVLRAISDETVHIFAFGQKWGPEANKRDQYFGFLPGNGIHDIHMNQGNVAGFVRDDGIYQDGGIIIHFPEYQNYPEQWVAMFLKFQSQSWHTDDRTGHTLRDGDAGNNAPHGGGNADGQDENNGAGGVGNVGGAGTTRDHQDPSEPNGLVRIVAAMVNPNGPDAGLETITLLNTTADSIDLDGWFVMDSRKTKYRIQGIGALARGATVAIPLPDTLQLPNRGGIITLLDPSGLKVDGVSYTKRQAQKQGESVVF